MDLIDKRDEVLRLFLEYGITENTENDLTKTDLADCAEQIVKKLIIGDVSKRFTEEQMIEASRYGYDYRHNTSFPNKNFDDNCKNNTKQWMTCI